MSILTPTQHLALTKLAHKGSQWLLAPALWLKHPNLVRWQIQLLEGFSYRKLSHFFYDALAASGLVERYALGDVTGRTGVYGRLRGNDEPLQQGDRVEIYRPLRADPKVSRRQRAKRRPR